MTDALLTYPKTAAEGMSVDFVGRRGALFWLAFKTGFLTILTLGFYRFWMKTRLRRWYWSAIRPGGHPMEYVGEPLEKLLGFFIAVVILTFYIGIVNLLLMFLSFSVFSTASFGYIASFAGVVPLWFYARYRARRYVLSRTRWRGVRFGLEKAAWGYTWRAVIHWCVTLVSLGTLWPRMTFHLEKYVTDRTYFGSARLHQDGHWTMLYRAAIPLIVALLILATSTVWMLWFDPVFGSEVLSISGIAHDILTDDTVVYSLDKPERLFLVPVALVGIVYGAIHYRFVSKRLMAGYKSAEGITLASRLSGPRVAFIYTFGSFIAYSVLVMGVAALAIAGLAVFGPSALVFLDLGLEEASFDIPQAVALALLVVFYLSIFLLWNVLYNTFVTFPLMRHLAKTTSLPKRYGLRYVSQRARDEFAEAEGFAEALDVGAAI